MIQKISGNFTSVTHSGVDDLNANFVRFGRSNLDILDRKRLARCPCNCGLGKFQYLFCFTS